MADDIIIGSELGPEFDLGSIQSGRIRLKLGAGLSILPDGTITAPSDTIEVDKTYMASYDLSGDGNAANGQFVLAERRLDAPFSLTAGDVVYTPIDVVNYVEIKAEAFYDPFNGGTGTNNQAQRVSPELELLKNGQPFSTASTGYQRQQSGHNSSSNITVWEDVLPASGDTYSVRSQQGSNQDDVLNVTTGTLTIKAIERVTVMAPVGVNNG